MLMPERLESHLDQNQIAYSLILHVPTHSAQVAASLMHFPGKEVGKTVALRAGEKILLAVLPASYRINFEKLSAVVGHQVQLLEPERCNETFPIVRQERFRLLGSSMACRYTWTRRSLKT
ncbi:MAG: aminoacyl-tRNA deacylase [Candidatus Acidiferrales bacterium]